MSFRESFPSRSLTMRFSGYLRARNSLDDNPCAMRRASRLPYNAAARRTTLSFNSRCSLFTTTFLQISQSKPNVPAPIEFDRCDLRISALHILARSICYTTVWPSSITRPRRGIGRPNPIYHALSTYRYPFLVGKFQGLVPKRLSLRKYSAWLYHTSPFDMSCEYHISCKLVYHVALYEVPVYPLIDET
ncbi:hypothetical protein M404DRAFT_35976 [Pisolithus tinctorius Marx 270]|uniref:Uncharacterized protein n=1 Tax=Pisolithus tinctorius Marx 270 TaxID=870435 RepID=A0A0C3MXC7_PISTI|nr:hypothetical protein M404DRAFT_35976 [Pisolithus tinctorius Marx 270]